MYADEIRNIYRKSMDRFRRKNLLSHKKYVDRSRRDYNNTENREIETVSEETAIYRDTITVQF